MFTVYWFLIQGETGILRKKFSNLQREIEKGQEEAKSAELENSKLQSIIRNLEKDILGLRHEITERDETIQEKEKRTYELKKKNQGKLSPWLFPKNFLCEFSRI